MTQSAKLPRRPSLLTLDSPVLSGVLTGGVFTLFMDKPRETYWSPDFPAQPIYPIGQVTDQETGEVFVMVRKAKCPPWVLTDTEFSLLAPVKP